MRRWIALVLWLAAVGWMWGISHFSLLEKEAEPGLTTFMPDYINHGAAYFLLAFLLFIALQRTTPRGFAVTFGLIVGLCLAFGLGMEYAQRYLTETRVFSLWDLLADGVGAALMFLFLLILKNAGSKGKQLYSFVKGEMQR